MSKKKEINFLGALTLEWYSDMETEEKDENLERNIKEFEDYLSSLGLDEELLKIHTLVKIEKSSFLG
ncbi:MAG TPA: hypothetical protein DDY68_02815 [Porphyromonadaceae bacterium]|nr:hypothetical protein [Porphyromonadaceae bacterium]